MRAIASSRGSTPRNREEARLHDGVDARAHAGFLRDRIGVDDVEPQLLLDDLLLHVERQLVPDRRRRERRVQQKHRRRLRRLEHVVPLEKLELMAPDEMTRAR